jgi:hypothetical protein
LEREEKSLSIDINSGKKKRLVLVSMSSIIQKKFDGECFQPQYCLKNISKPRNEIFTQFDFMFLNHFLDWKNSFIML